MSDAHNDRRRSVWNRWYRRAFPIYWVFLFCASHFPKLSLPSTVPQSDKIAHLFAYGLLAFLMWRFREAIGGPLSERFVRWAFVVVVAYALVDEYLQAFVGRNADLMDWACDVVGAGIVLGFMEWRRRAAERRNGPNSAVDTLASEQ